MDVITATEFKAKCLDILDHVPINGLGITKRGKVVAKIYPMSIDNTDLIGLVPDLRIESVEAMGVRWDAES